MLVHYDDYSDCNVVVVPSFRTSFTWWIAWWNVHIVIGMKLLWCRWYIPIFLFSSFEMRGGVVTVRPYQCTQWHLPISAVAAQAYILIWQIRRGHNCLMGRITTEIYSTWSGFMQIGSRTSLECLLAPYIWYCLTIYAYVHSVMKVRYLPLLFLYI